MKAAFLLIGIFFLITARAAPFAVQVGEARIALDSPPGFADSSFTGSPRLQELAESQTSPSNRILTFAISDGDLRLFMTGDKPQFRRYMIVVTPKALERERMSAAGFAQLVAEALRDFGPPAAGDFVKHLDAQPQGRAHLLAELRRDPEVVSVLQGTRVPLPRRGFGEDKGQYVLSSLTLMLLRGKALNLSVYTLYDGPADLEWISATTASWIAELQRLNSR
ncbi:MAG: hypothetical protein HY467_04925 [Betaproteobacteria bacterium]|nr:hypothetical protein [Betaproteobacteria bacterium]